MSTRNVAVMTDTDTARDDARQTADRSPRESVIRDLYALAAFYVANPDHPLPTSLSVFHHVDDVADVHAVANTYGGRVYGHEQTDHMLPGVSMRVGLVVSVPYGTKPKR